MGITWKLPNGQQRTLLPIVDDFIDKSKIHSVQLKNINIQKEGLENSTLPIEKSWPYLNFFERPYGDLFKNGSICDEKIGEEPTIVGISSEFYMDAFNITEEGNTQIKQPNAGYWCSPHLLGDRNWLWQWGIAPKDMHRYSYASILEKESLEMTFFGASTTLCRVFLFCFSLIKIQGRKNKK